MNLFNPATFFPMSYVVVFSMLNDMR